MDGFPGRPAGRIWGGTSSTESDRLINGDPHRALQAYESWLWKAINVTATNVSSIALEYAIASARTGETTPVLFHEAIDLLKKPNKFMDGYELRHLTCASELLFGNTLWYMPPAVDDMGVPLRQNSLVPAAVYILPWQNVEPQRDAKRGIYAFRLTNSTMEPIPAEFCALKKDPDLGDPLIGRATATAAAQAVDLNRFAMHSNTSFFKHGAQAGAIIESEHDYPQSTIDDFYKDFQLNHAGAGNSHFPIVIPQGWKFHEHKIGGMDINFDKGLQWSRDEELGMFGVPLAILGQTREYNRANIEGAIFAFQWGTIGPRIESYCRFLENQYFPRFDDAQWECTSEPFIIRDREADRADMIARLGGPGRAVTTQNEEREAAGWDPVKAPLADELTINAGIFGIEEDRVAAAMFDADGSDAIEKRKVSPEERQAIVWRKFSKRHSASEKKLNAEYKRQYARQRDEVVKRIRGGATTLAGILPDPEAEATKIFRKTRPILESTIEQAARQAYRDIGVGDYVIGKAEEPDVPVIDNDSVLTFIEDLSLTNLVSFNKENREVIRDIIADGVAAGQEMKDIVKDVTEYYDGVTGYKAFRIARTETTAAANWGSLAAVESVDFPVTKIWIPALDERTRDTHKAAGSRYAPGKGIDKRTAFSVGGEKLMYPGDPAGSGGNVINCRCTMGFEAEE